VYVCVNMCLELVSLYVAVKKKWCVYNAFRVGVCMCGNENVFVRLEMVCISVCVRVYVFRVGV